MKERGQTEDITPRPQQRRAGTDLDWSIGDGLTVRGPATDLLLAVLGRPVDDDALEGIGDLRRRM